MRFNLQQRFSAPVSDVIDLYSDPDFHTSLTGLTKVATPTLVSCERTADHVEMRLSYRFIADLPGAVTAVIDPHRLTWVEHTVFDLDAATSKTTLLPDHYADKLKASITCRFAADGQGAVRSVAGDLAVHVFLVGGQVEKAIVSGLSEHLTEESAQAEARLS